LSACFRWRLPNPAN
jgi:hypothetical protein